MKAVYSIVFLSLIVINVSNGIRVKRGLSTEEQKKLVDTLNADRQAVGKKLGVKFEQLTYDVALEKEADAHPCNFSYHHMDLVPLKGNTAVREYFEALLAIFDIESADPISRLFFHPKKTTIGCSKEKTCTEQLAGEAGKGPKWTGKIAKFWGACMFGPSHINKLDRHDTPKKFEVPNHDKYVELLGDFGPSPDELNDSSAGPPKTAEDSSPGPQGSQNGSTERFFSLTLFLGILTLHF
ncbi:hypothetical protein B9Z55_008780 [Caenorhabditis nigoni]|uniref:SCP domain-containing protein n=1 Tax=Caenorhabditis nigoni TaxID=1611254 RepID=A0A2G5UPN2_9PELO|nr:hypothetical protein B9Z55_008780 [Caenorhabditis nigoni]